MIQSAYLSIISGASLWGLIALFFKILTTYSNYKKQPAFKPTVFYKVRAAIAPIQAKTMPTTTLPMIFKPAPARFPSVSRVSDS